MTALSNVHRGDRVAITTTAGLKAEFVVASRSHSYVSADRGKDGGVHIFRREDIARLDIVERALPTTPGYYEAVERFPMGGAVLTYHPYRLTGEGQWQTLSGDGFVNTTEDSVRGLGKLALLGSQARA